jgi:hypothetical protein
MMGDALDDALNEDGDAEAEDAIVGQVLDEIGITFGMHALIIILTTPLACITPHHLLRVQMADAASVVSTASAAVNAAIRTIVVVC